METSDSEFRRSRPCRGSGRRAEHGQMLLLVAVGIVVLIAIVGLANDVGFAWRMKLTMQSAADAAAVAGADALFMSGGTVSVTAAAQAAATQNGFTDGAGTPTNPNTVTVAVHNPPTSGPNAGNANAVEVIISQAQPTFFVKVLGFSTMPVSARAVASIQSSDNCIYSLNPSASGALLLRANAHITSSCGVVVNSSSSSAVITNSGATIAAPSLGVVGGITGGGSLPSTTSTGVAAFSDPLSYLSEPPAAGSCTSLATVPANTTFNLSAGYYCGLTVNSNATVNLISSGTYTFGGNVTLNSNVVFNATGGVTLYFKSGSLSMSSNVIMNLTAPTSGPYAGIAIFQSRSDTTTLTLNSNSGLNITGAVYAPSANLLLNSNAFTDVYSILVASQITIESNSAINIHNDYSSLPNGSPIKMAAAVE